MSFIPFHLYGLIPQSIARFCVKGYLIIIKILQQQRHTGMDCRYPDYMDVMFTCLTWRLGSGNPCRNDEPFTLAEASC